MVILCGNIFHRVSDCFTRVLIGSDGGLSELPEIRRAQNDLVSPVKCQNPTGCTMRRSRVFGSNFSFVKGAICEKKIPPDKEQAAFHHDNVK